MRTDLWPRFKAGDEVIVERRPTTQEIADWEDSWDYNMDDNIGQLMIVRRQSPSHIGYSVELDDGYWYPTCVLRPAYITETITAQAVECDICNSK